MTPITAAVLLALFDDERPPAMRVTATHIHISRGAVSWAPLTGDTAVELAGALAEAWTPILHAPEARTFGRDLAFAACRLFMDQIERTRRPAPFEVVEGGRTVAVGVNFAAGPDLTNPADVSEGIYSYSFTDDEASAAADLDLAFVGNLDLTQAPVLTGEGQGPRYGLATQGGDWAATCANTVAWFTCPGCAWRFKNADDRDLVVLDLVEGLPLMRASLCIPGARICA